MYSVFEHLLHEFGITPYKVSKDTGVTQASLSKWKSGKSTPSSETLQKIADYFGVSVDYLMTGKEQHEKESAFETKDETERKLIMLCRKAGDVSQEEKDDIVKLFESTIDLYLKAKGIKKE